MIYDKAPSKKNRPKKKKKKSFFRIVHYERKESVKVHRQLDGSSQGKSTINASHRTQHVPRIFSRI